MTKREHLIMEISESILGCQSDHPTRVGISGITASGKSTLADELAEELRRRKALVVRNSIDNFHNPKAIRYRKGKGSAVGYYEDAHDYDSFIHKFLIPIGPGGNRVYHRRTLDLIKDLPVDSETETAEKESIFIIDGTFLFKDFLYDYFDFRIFVDVRYDIARKRGAKRDAQALGGYEKAEQMFINRYHAASKRYLEQHAPKLCANIVINNNDFQNPTIEKVKGK